MRARGAIGVAALLAAAAGQAAETPICTDRPAKGNGVCTVPPGRFQIESSPFDWLRLDEAGTTVDTLSVGSTVVKFGLTSRSDLQVGFTPLVRIVTREVGGSDTLSGFGDVTVRYKQRLTADDAPVQLAVIPFVKLPTAKRGIGNRKLEGGLALPINLPAGALTVTFGPEADVLAGGDGRGRHLALVNLIGLSATVAPRLTLTGELWNNLNFDPAGTIMQASADAALAYTVSNDFQLDAGVNAGLTRDTPDVELYAGLSLRL